MTCQTGKVSRPACLKLQLPACGQVLAKASIRSCTESRPYLNSSLSPQGHTGDIYDVAFAPHSSNKQILSCSADAQVRAALLPEPPLDLQVRLTDLNRNAVRPFSLHIGKVRTVVPVDIREWPKPKLCCSAPCTSDAPVPCSRHAWLLQQSSASNLSAKCM